MGIQSIGTRSDEPVADHRAVMAYIESPEWESRLREARLKRQVVLAARATAADLRHMQERETGKLRAPRPDLLSSISHQQTPLAVKEAFRLDPLLMAVPKVEGPRRWGRVLIRTISGALAGFSLFGLVTVAGLVWLQVSAVGGDLTLRDDAASHGRPDDFAPLSPADHPLATVPHQSSLENPEGTKSAQQRASFGNLASVLREFATDYQITVITTANLLNSIAEMNHAEGSSVAVRTTTFITPRPVVAYFHAADAAAAVRFSAKIEGDAMDLRGLLPSPPAGTLEVLIAGG